MVIVIADFFVKFILLCLVPIVRNDVTDSFEPLSESDIVPVGRSGIRVFGSILLR